MSKKVPALTFEENMTRLQEIVAALETGEQPLDKGLALYKEGAALTKLCRAELENARNEIRIVTESGLAPFEAIVPTEPTEPTA